MRSPLQRILGLLSLWLDARVAGTALGDLRTQLLEARSDTSASKHDR